ncbi:MAG: serine hydrolase [Polyangiales bacterium]
MKRVLLVVAWACGGLLAVLICVALAARDRVLQLAHSWQERADGSELATRLVAPHDLLDYFAAHPEQVAIASWELGHASDGLYVHADRRQPMAAAGELLVLARYAQLAAAGDPAAQERVPVARWEQYGLPSSEVGAHLAALHELRESGRVALGDTLAEPSVQTGDVVRAMIRFGDQAAGDYLMQRFGRIELDALALQLGLGADDASLMPYAGVQLSWLGTEHAAHAPELLARYRVLGRDAYVQLTWGLAARLREDRAFAARERLALEQHAGGLLLKEQVQLVAALLPRGSARQYAELMQRIASGELPGSEHMRGLLERPIGAARPGVEHDVFAAKSGSLPGVISSLTYARPAGSGSLRVCAVFLQQLPPAVWLHLSHGLLRQRFEAELLQDEAFFALAKRKLGAREGTVARDATVDKPHHANAQ